jgi:hypothetical protein
LSKFQLCFSKHEKILQNVICLCEIQWGLQLLNLDRNLCEYFLHTECLHGNMHLIFSHHFVWTTHNLMLNYGKKIRTFRDKKKYILTLVLSEKKFLNEAKNHNPPPFKLNGRSLIWQKLWIRFWSVLKVRMFIKKWGLGSLWFFF